MKVLVINCSPVRDGATARIIDHIHGNLCDRAEVRRVCIDDFSIALCRGCRSCHRTAKCVIEDDVDRLMEQYEWADAVVAVAPSYWADVPGQLKTFFDRNTPYGDTNPNRALKADKPIKGVAIAVRAGVRRQENEGILNSIAHYYGHLGIDCVKRISVCETDTPADLQEKHPDVIREVYELGKNIGCL